MKGLIFLVFVSIVEHGNCIALLTALPLYGKCQTVCNGIWVGCYAAAGFVAGTVTVGASTPAAIIACNSAQGVCMANCATLLTATVGASVGLTFGTTLAVAAIPVGIGYLFYKYNSNKMERQRKNNDNIKKSSCG